MIAADHLLMIIIQDKHPQLETLFNSSWCVLLSGYTFKYVEDTKPFKIFSTHNMIHANRQRLNYSNKNTELA